MGCIVIDPNNGTILQIKDQVHGSAGDVFLQWQWLLYPGKVWLDGTHSGVPVRACLPGAICHRCYPQAAKAQSTTIA
jgi:hypothetical protein